MRNTVLFLLMFSTAISCVHAACVAHDAPQRPRLIELYTSEGCSSCPPAEQWLNGLHDDASQVALEFHVDYWDELGWPDPFADARYTARQRALAQRDGRGVVYTPQIVVDGSSWKGWPRPPSPAAPIAAPPAMTLEVSGDAPIRVGLESDGADIARYRMYVALTESGLASTVAAGENRGRRLTHDHVVRDFAGPLAMPRADAALDPPPGFDRSRASIVAFAEDADTGEVVQVVRLPLDTCLR